MRFSAQGSVAFLLRAPSKCTSGAWNFFYLLNSFLFPNVLSSSTRVSIHNPPCPPFFKITTNRNTFQFSEASTERFMVSEMVPINKAACGRCSLRAQVRAASPCCSEVARLGCEGSRTEGQVCNRWARDSASCTQCLETTMGRNVQDPCQRVPDYNCNTSEGQAAFRTVWIPNF